MIYRNVFCLWMTLFLYPGGLLGQVYSDRKVCSFPTTEKTSIEVTNKYGKIHVVAWDNDSVRFEVDLRITASNIEKMQKLRNNISFEFTATKYYVIAKTNFADAGNVITDIKDAFIPSNQVVIDYLVYVPKVANLKIDSKFGDVYMDDYDGNLEISLSNGDMKANILTGSPVIRISSGDGTINNIQDGKVFASYSDLQIKQASNLNMETRSSRIMIDKADNLKIDSRRDKFEITEVRDISANGYFTGMEIENLLKELRCTLKYGNITVNRVDNTFSFININSEYTDIDLFFDRGTSYNIDITHRNDVYIKLPAGLTQVQTKDFDVEQKMKLTFGKIGSAVTETSPKVEISAPEKCVINIIHK